MDSMVEIYLKRATNEISAAKILFKISDDADSKQGFEVSSDETFYSSVISHSYYSIFYSATSLLLTKQIKLKAPDIHKKTYEVFKREFVETGVLDVELLNIYKKMIVRADELLSILKEERKKRGQYTYSTIPQANVEPANTSLKHAEHFVAAIRNVILE